MKKIVIDLGFGDSGKGLVVDWLASKNKEQSVVRYSGGHQVGHCVRTETKKHIFSNFGSGTMRGLPTFWNCKTVDPFGFCNEYEDLKQYKPEIKIDPNCPVTTPLDKRWNILEAHNRYHGTMGVGFGKTIEREENHYHLFFQDLLYPDLLKEKLKQIEEYYGLIIGDGKLTEKGRNTFLDSCQKMIGLVDQDLIITPDTIYESSQGLMLDMEYGIFPHVTRSKVGTQEIDLKDDDELFLVTRACQTRHGTGWCSKHHFTPNAPDETNTYNEFQGEFKTRILDLDLLNYAINIDKGIRESKNRNLVITCLDHLNSETRYRVTVNTMMFDLVCESEFVKYIINNLPEFKHVFVSHGPTAKDISQVK